MRRLAITAAGIMPVALQQGIPRSEDARYDHRLHGASDRFHQGDA